jgi:hypothetical protein
VSHAGREAALAAGFQLVALAAQERIDQTFDAELLQGLHVAVFSPQVAFHLGAAGGFVLQATAEGFEGATQPVSPGQLI